MSIRPFWGDPLSKVWEGFEPCHFAHTLPSRQLAPNILVNRINCLKPNIFTYMYMACYVQCICMYVWFQIHTCQCVGVMIGVQTWVSNLTLSLSYIWLNLIHECKPQASNPGKPSRKCEGMLCLHLQSHHKLPRILEGHKTNRPHVDPGHRSPFLPYAQPALYLLNNLHRRSPNSISRCIWGIIQLWLANDHEAKIVLHRGKHGASFWTLCSLHTHCI